MVIAEHVDAAQTLDEVLRVERGHAQRFPSARDRAAVSFRMSWSE